jgi:hypothetical protein
LEYILEDFVDREEALGWMWRVARREVDSRLLVVCGEPGIGKSYLLEEFLGEYQKEAKRWVEIDFQGKIDSPLQGKIDNAPYLMVVMEIWKCLGPVGFEKLQSAIDNVLTQAVPAQYRQAQPVPALLGEPEMEAAGRQGAAEVDQAMPGAGLSFYGDTNVYGNIAGRDFYLFLQVVQQDDPYVRRWARDQVDAALKDCLITVTQHEPVVFFFDHWEDADKDMRDWLTNSLLNWAISLDQPKLVVIAACASKEDIDKRRRTKRVPLFELSQEFVKKYLLEKKDVRLEDLDQFILAGGSPILLARLAERYQRMQAR